MKKHNDKKIHQVILVCGGSCSGKSVFSQWFRNATVLEMDSFYVGKSKMKPDKDGQYNFDEPAALNLQECAQALQDLSEGKSVQIPIYDMRTSERKGTETVNPPKESGFIILNGIFTFFPEFRELGDLKIYIDTPPELRVARRILRDVSKGRNSVETLAWSITVEQNHEKYVEPMKQFADLILPHSHNPLQFPQVK